MKRFETLYLARDRDGKFLVTCFEPKLAKIVGSNEQAFYIRPGDPVGYRNMCGEATPRMFVEHQVEEAVMMLPLSQPRRVHVTFEFLD